MEIRKFLEARLAEEQERAERGQWTAQFLSQGGRRDPGNKSAHAKAIEREGGYSPARVLREVAAKRAILKRHHRGDRNECAGCGYSGDLDEPRIDEEFESCPELAALASVWSDHPDFDPAWRING